MSSYNPVFGAAMLVGGATHIAIAVVRRHVPAGLAVFSRARAPPGVGDWLNGWSQESISGDFLEQSDVPTELGR
jgi:hypothetical protein